MARRRKTAHRARLRRERQLVALLLVAAALSLILAPLEALVRQMARALAGQPLLAALVGLCVLGAMGSALTLWAPRRSVWWFGSVYAVETLRGLTPARFELAVADLLRARGYQDVRHTGGARDLAADLTCRDRCGARVVVQCKRYRAGCAVTSPEMQQFIGMIYAHHHADYGIYVTTSTFTRPASALAHQHGIRLLDGDALAAQLPAQRRTHTASMPHPADFQRNLSAE